MYKVLAGGGVVSKRNVSMVPRWDIRYCKGYCQVDIITGHC